MKAFWLYPKFASFHWQDHARNTCYGMVVLAEDESAARQIAGLESKSEGPEAWTNSEFSSCVELPFGRDGLVLAQVSS